MVRVLNTIYGMGTESGTEHYGTGTEYYGTGTEYLAARNPAMNPSIRAQTTEVATAIHNSSVV